MKVVWANEPPVGLTAVIIIRQIGERKGVEDTDNNCVRLALRLAGGSCDL